MNDKMAGLTFQLDNKFEYKKLLGKGCFGQVILARDKILEKDVALKVIKEATSASFAEAENGNLLSHPNLVKVHSADYCSEQKILIIEMDYHPNGSICTRYNSENFLPVKEAVGYIKDVLRGLEALHAENRYHNDIKPRNILVGNNEEGILTDYGISLKTQNKEPATCRSFYILHSSPEMQSQNLASVKSDLYQVGMTLFRLICGDGILEDKFNEIGMDNYARHKQEDKLIASKDYPCFIPSGLKKVIQKAVSSNPEQRYHSAREMRNALENLTLIGSWTVTNKGEYIGKDSRYEYFFQESQQNGKHNFIAFKKSLKSEKINKITKYCLKQGTKSALNKAKKNFMQDVVLGKI